MFPAYSTLRESAGRSEDPKGVQRNHLVSPFPPPIHHIGVGPGTLSQAPITSLDVPGTVLRALGLDNIESFPSPWVPQFSDLIEHSKGLEHVVVPVEWVVEFDPSRVNYRLRSAGLEQSMLQEELGGPIDRFANGLVVGSL